MRMPEVLTFLVLPLDLGLHVAGLIYPHTPGAAKGRIAHVNRRGHDTSCTSPQKNATAPMRMAIKDRKAVARLAY
jgi:hypothetical protein